MIVQCTCIKSIIYNTKKTIKYFYHKLSKLQLNNLSKVIINTYLSHLLNLQY